MYMEVNAVINADTNSDRKNVDTDSFVGSFEFVQGRIKPVIQVS